jgi:hypothetical protein
MKIHTLHALSESLVMAILMPFIILSVAMMFIFTLILLLAWWPISPFCIYVKRKRELTEELTEKTVE